MKQRIVYCIFKPNLNVRSLDLMFSRYGIIVNYINKKPINKLSKNFAIIYIINKYKFSKLICYFNNCWTNKDWFTATGDINAQELVVAKFIIKYIYYSKPINLNFNYQKLIRTIDFANDPAELVLNNQYLLNPIAKKHGSSNLFLHALNLGLFFKSAKNRREKNYWLPGLNAGIPLVPKLDPVHEISYMAHDFGHFLMPDLIFTGNDNRLYKQVYIIYRMMTEAFTLVLTDMVFVDSIYRSNINYNYAARKIYPLFQDFNLDLTNKKSFANILWNLLHAMVDYCLRGSDLELKKLLNKSNNYHNLYLFKNKYKKFFIEDWKWTRKNYDYFARNYSFMQQWWQTVSVINNWYQLELYTIKEFVAKIEDHPGDIIEKIFQALYNHIIYYFNKKININNLLPRSTRLAKAFARYMMGQLAFFIYYKNFIPDANSKINTILNFLYKHKCCVTNEDILFCRTIYEESVDLLLKQAVINYDDAATYKEIFPLFEPEFAYYDEADNYYDELTNVAKDMVL